MIIKEFLQTFRDKRMRYILFFPPMIQLVMFGYVVTTDVADISTAFYDLDQSYESRELARRLVASGYFDIRFVPESPGEVRELLDRGRITCAIQVNRGFSRDVKKGVPTEIQVLVDGSDSNTATVAANYAVRIIAKYSQDLSLERVSAAVSRADVRVRAWYNPDLKSRNFNVPGVMASIIMLIGLMLTSMAIVREREIGTMEQLMVTPIRPVELMLGKTIPFAIISFLDMLLVTAVGTLWFQVPIKGSLLLLVLCTAIYLMPVLGIGLFISTISRTQQQALMATLLFYMPAILLSGFIFPIENMPKIFQYVTYLNPLRFFLVIIRGVFLKGNGVSILWPQMVALFALGTVLLSASALRLRKRLG
jgi:ABC-2 type transport system permease protein